MAADVDRIEIEEAKALLAYVARRGIEGTEDQLKALHAAIADYEAAADDAAKKSKEGAVFDAYAALAKEIFPKFGVNGRTLLDSRRGRRTTFKVMLWTLIFLALALGTQMLGLWAGDHVLEESGLLWLLANAEAYFFRYMNPFFWGGAGACVYLIKRLNDEISEGRFSQAAFTGWGTRILLGAALGAAVVIIFDLSRLEGEASGLSESVVAFLTGIGVKVVYGAIERTIATLAEKLNIAGVRRAEVAKAVARGGSEGGPGSAEDKGPGKGPGGAGKEPGRGPGEPGTQP